MQKVKKIPQRQCVGCREMKDERALSRAPRRLQDRHQARELSRRRVIFKNVHRHIFELQFAPRCAHSLALAHLRGEKCFY